MTQVKFGLTIYDYPPADVFAMAQALEDFGFASLWWGEHYVVPGQVETKHPTDTTEASHKKIVAETTMLYDPFCALGVLAAKHQTLEVNTAISIVPLTPPLLLARSCATLHEFSGGRFRLGMGAGWMVEEFDALGIPFKERGSRLDEGIDILRKALRGGFFEHHGKHFDFGPVQITPHATPVPLIGGGNTPKALKRTAAVTDGWINSFVLTLDEAIRIRDEVEEQRAKLGTSDRKFEYFVRPKTPDRATIESFVKAGFTNLIIYAHMEYAEWGGQTWVRGDSVSIADKRAKLKSIADQIGVGKF